MDGRPYQTSDMSNNSNQQHMRSTTPSQQVYGGGVKQEQPSDSNMNKTVLPSRLPSLQMNPVPHQGPLPPYQVPGMQFQGQPGYMTANPGVPQQPSDVYGGYPPQPQQPHQQIQQAPYPGLTHQHPHMMSYQPPQAPSSTHYYPHDDHQQAKKQRTASRKTRKKTMIACETCRLKKVKCTNEKPICQSCRTHGYTCFYREESYAYEAAKAAKENTPLTVADSASPASTGNNDALMTKLDLILKEIETLKHTAELSNPLALSTKEVEVQPYITPGGSEPMDGYGVTKQVKDASARVKWYTSVEFMLTWPYFAKSCSSPNVLKLLTSRKDAIPLPDIDIKDFIEPAKAEKYSKRLIHHLFYFINSFVNNVHTKAPVVDLAKFYTTAEHICRRKTFDIDTSTGEYYPAAVPLLAAALGTLCAPLDPSASKPLPEFKSSAEWLQYSDRYNKFAKIYKFASFKGFIDRDDFADYPDRSPLDYCIVKYLQKTCYMYLLKPLDAWECLQRAASTLLVYLKSHNYPTTADAENKNMEAVIESDISLDDRKLVERLYWIIYKEESEMRVELSPHVSPEYSDILNFPAPSFFPVPVLFDPAKFKDATLEIMSSSSSSQDDLDATDRELIDTSDCKTINEQNDNIWYGFLNETALRKLENNYLADLYGEPPSKAWSFMFTEPNGLNIMAAKVKRYMQEVHDVVDQLHPVIKEALENTEDQVLAKIELMKHYPMNEKYSPTANENNKKLPIFKLSESLVFIKTRLVSMNMLLTRPIYFYLSCLETKEEILSFITNPAILEIMKEALSAANIANPELLKHRHNGSWYVLRNLLVGSLYIFTVIPKLTKYPEILQLLSAHAADLAFPSKETMAIFLKQILATIDYWRDEAPEFSKGMDIIYKLAEEHAFDLS